MEEGFAKRCTSERFITLHSLHEYQAKFGTIVPLRPIGVLALEYAEPATIHNLVANL